MDGAQVLELVIMEMGNDVIVDVVPVTLPGGSG